MYRLLFFVLVLAGTGLGLYLGAPWWFPALVAGVAAGVLPLWRRGSFWYALLAGILAWGTFVTYVHLQSEGRLSNRLAVTFGLDSGWWLVVVTALWGGLTAGLGAWFVTSVRRLLTGNHDRRPDLYGKQ